MGKDEYLEGRIKKLRFLRMLFLILALVLIIGPVILLIFAGIARINHLYTNIDGILTFFGWLKLPYHLCKVIYTSAPSVYILAVALLIVRVVVLGPKLRRAETLYDELPDPALVENNDEHHEESPVESPINEPKQEEPKPVDKPRPKDIDKGVEFFDDVELSEEPYIKEEDIKVTDSDNLNNFFDEEK